MNNIVFTQLSIPELKDLIKEGIREALHESPTSERRPDALLNLPEAARFLKLAEPTLYSYTSGRKIPFLKKGKKLYFRQSDLEGWLQSGRRKTIDEIAVEAGTFTSKLQSK